MEVKIMKKTFKKRAFISAIAMLIVSAIVLTSATYAWFSMAKQVTVDSMELNITSPEGIQISANTTNFTTKLTTANITGTDDTAAGKRFNAYEGNINNIPTTIIPSSSAFKHTNTLPIWFTGSINDQGTMDIYSVSNEVGSGFVAFDLFVKLQSATTVKFGGSTVTCEGNSEVLTAMRIAMLNLGTVAEKADAATIKSTLNQPLNGFTRKVIYELDANNHTTTAATNGASGYITTKGISSTGTGVKVNSPYTNVTSNVDTIYATIAKTSSEAKIDLDAGISRVRVYLWMEGNDVDCANDVAGATINFNLVLDID
jgi:hypothetical protein